LHHFDEGAFVATNDDILSRLTAVLPPGSLMGSRDRFGTLEVAVAPKAWGAAVQAARDDAALACDLLVDLVGVDYSQYPGHTGDRFGVSAHLKSLSLGHRVSLRTGANGVNPLLPTLCGLYRNANFLEREIFDQFGVRFEGHPNLKRLLNHHEFVGHPLRKDYPIERGQTLSVSDPLMDEMDKRLEAKGWTGTVA